MKTKLGICSLCGGMVTVPTVFMSIYPPTPECERCGAEPTPKKEEIIDMRPRKYDYRFSTETLSAIARDLANASK